MKVDLKTLKISLIIIIFICGVFGVLSPRLFKPFGSRLSYSSLLSSGVLLAAALVHLLGDAADGLSSNSPLPLTADGDAFPWAYFFCGSSFYFLYFFEKFVFHALSSHNHATDIDTGNTNLKQRILHDHTHSTSDLIIQQPPLSLNNSSSLQAVQTNLSPAPIQINQQHNERMEPIDLNQQIADELDEHTAEIFAVLVQKNYLNGIILLIGLGLHSFLAGVALGSSTKQSQAVALGIAIISHKYLAAFALGVPLYKADIKAVVCIAVSLLFGSLTPIGIGIGWILSRSFEGWLGDLFISIAAGTFIYVSICEVLIPEFSQQKKEEKITYRVEESRRELSRSGTPRLIASQQLKAIKIRLKREQTLKAKRHQILKTFAVVIGFVVMSLLAFWV